MDLFLLHSAINGVTAVTLALSFGLALLLERWCTSALFRLMFAGMSRAAKSAQQTRA
jgi:hypothetical protein